LRGVVGHHRLELLGELELHADIAEYARQRDLQGVTQSGEQLRTRLLLATFDLGYVAETHPGLRRDVAQGHAVAYPVRTQRVADQLSEHSHFRPPLDFRPRLGCTLSTTPRPCQSFPTAEIRSAMSATAASTVPVRTAERSPASVSRRTSVPFASALETKAVPAG